MRKPLGNTHLEHQEELWEYNIKTNVREMGCDYGNWM